MSSISAGTTTGTALVQTGDTTGNLVIKTGSNATTALTISGTDQSITVAGGLNLGAPVAVASGGTGANTAANARTNLGLAIGTDVLAPNGSGANLTSLNASSISSGTLGVANGGTGATTLTANNVLLGNGTSALQAVAPGSSGNVLTSNGTTWTSSAPSGGVTSLNGQTGAITDTTIGNIGSHIIAVTTNTAPGAGQYASISANTTIAGSSIRYNYTSGVSSLSGLASFYYQSGGGTSYGGGGTSLSGTWRFLSWSTIYRDNCGNYSIWYPALLVRIS